jgi:hypothetical protein
MSQDAQEQTGRLVAMRKSLAGVKVLMDMKPDMDEKQAEAAGVTVLHAVDGKVLLGVFDVAAVDSKITAGPKGFAPHLTRYFFVPERAAVVAELLESMDANMTMHRKSGVLLTGPNGVGKSADGLLAFLCCLAQGRFAVYIPDAKVWVAAAEAGRGDEFLLERFFMQNVDKIATTPVLRAVFDSRLRGIKVDASVMDAFRSALTTRPGPAVAVIVDEVQNITQAIGKSRVPGATAAERTAASYFHLGWETWNAANLWFVRMDIASWHGTRERKIPSGEEGRLRFVSPWALESARMALACEASPAFVEQEKVRDRIIHLAGGVIGRLLLLRGRVVVNPITMRLRCRHYSSTARKA